MPSILIVDDEALIRWSLSESLEGAGYVVDEAGSAAEALSRLDPADPCLRVILLDLKLPDSSDLGLLQRILRLTPGTRVILMTAHGTPEILDEALRLGAFSVLTKPFDLHEIVDLVRSAASQ
jgi:two-component system nitrogen regulation response regulator GlnG